MRQRSDTGDELGFGEEIVLMKMLMEMSPLNERSVGDDDGDDFPLREGNFPGGTALPEL